MAAVTVTTSATAIYTDTASTVNDPKQVVITNNSGATVYLGGATVTASGTPATDGIALLTGGSFGFDGSPGLVVYGVVASSTAEVRVEAF